MAWNDEDEDESELHPEGPDASEASEEPAEVPCPYCGLEISEEAERCPYCGSYVHIAGEPEKRQWWWMVGLGVLILLILAYVLRRW